MQANIYFICSYMHNASFLDMIIAILEADLSVDNQIISGHENAHLTPDMSLRYENILPV